MPRKLKVYQTSQGFYDLAIAAPSMKAALEAWGANNNLFHQGFARESNDSKVIAVAMERPGIVLRRTVGSDVAFREHADLPSAASLEAPVRLGKERPAKARPAEAQKIVRRLTATPLPRSRKSGSAAKGSGRRKKLLRRRRGPDVRLRSKKLRQRSKWQSAIIRRPWQR